MSDITFTDGEQAGSLSRETAPQASTRSLRPRGALAFVGVLRLLDHFVFGSLLGLIVLVAIPYGTVEPWWIAIYEVVVFFLVTLWILQGLFGSWDVSEKHLLAPAGALVLFAFLQTVSWFGDAISSDPFETRLTFLKFLAFACNGALLLRYTSNQRRMQALIHVVIGVAVASALFGIVRQTMQHSELGFVLPYLKGNSGFGQFVNKNHFALLMEMAIGLSTGLMFGGGVRRERLLFHISAVALMWTALVLTSSRGGLLSMVIQTVFLFAILIWWRVKTRGEGLQPVFDLPTTRKSHEPTSGIKWKLALPTVAMGVCLLAVIAISAVWVGGDVLVTRLESLPGEIRSETLEPHAGVRRREVWAATWNLFKAYPLYGSGFGAYGIAITRFHPASGKWTPEAAHNDYLELLASGGIVGAGLVVWFGLVFIKRARRRLSSCHPFRRAACLGALTGTFGVLVHNTVDFGLHVTANTLVFIALVVIATKRLHSEQTT